MRQWDFIKIVSLPIEPIGLTVGERRKLYVFCIMLLDSYAVLARAWFSMARLAHPANHLRQSADLYPAGVDRMARFWCSAAFVSPWLVLVLGCLATWRLTSLLSLEAGPFHALLKFRSWVRREAPKKAHLGEGVTCPYCSSVWMSAIVTPCLCWQGQIAWQFSWCHWIAFSAGAIILHQLFGMKK